MRLSRFNTPRMAFSYQKGLALLIGIQLGLIYLVFRHFFEEPNTWMLYNAFDGLKNYYTLISYILQDPSQGYAWYSSMHYPFGDYIFYTDNTPVLSMAMRWWHINISDISNCIIPVFNTFIIANILIASLIIYDIGKLIKMKSSACLLMAIGITWTYPMILRMIGHSNMSMTMLIIGCILANCEDGSGSNESSMASSGCLWHRTGNMDFPIGLHSSVLPAHIDYFRWSIFWI